MDSSVSYEGDEVLLICSHGLYSQHAIFFITYEWAQSDKVFDPGKPF